MNSKHVLRESWKLKIINAVTGETLWEYAIYAEPTKDKALVLVHVGNEENKSLEVGLIDITEDMKVVLG